MIRTGAIVLAFLLSFCAAALAQTPSGPGGPGPTPSPWTVNGPALWPTGLGCITMPPGVPGGCQGNNTINATGLFVNGVAPVMPDQISNAWTSAGSQLYPTGNPCITMPPTVACEGANTLNALGLFVNGVAVLTAIPANSTIVTPTITSPVVTGAFTATGLVTNADLVNSTMNINGVTCTLGPILCSISATASSITAGSTGALSIAAGNVLYGDGTYVQSEPIGNIVSAGAGINKTGTTTIVINNYNYGSRRLGGM